MPGLNLDPNPAAGVDLTGIVSDQTITRLTGQSGLPRTTGYSITFPGAAYSAYLSSVRVPVTVGDPLTVVGYVMANAALNVLACIGRWNGTSYVGATDQQTIALAANTWTLVRCRTSALPSGTYDTATLHFDGPTGWAAGNVMSQSCVRMDRVNDPALAFFDGDSSGWAWSGAPRLSTSYDASGPEPGRFLLAGV